MEDFTGTISVVILTFNRPDILSKNLSHLLESSPEFQEVIVIDNSTNDETQGLMENLFPQVKYIRNPRNVGVAGRNRGLEEAKGDIVVTLDDDVIGLGPGDFRFLREKFKGDDRLGALCFRVLHFESGSVCNWCHPCSVEDFALDAFLTYEISEGAVAFRRSALLVSGTYFEGFFISHEGKDLAYRLLNAGYDVSYDGRIFVTHWHDQSGRPDWRRYYYDTRNAIWLALRNMPLSYAGVFLFRTLGAMGVYSLRDGFLIHWFKGIRDGISGIAAIKAERKVWTKETKEYCLKVDSRRPGFIYMIRNRLFRRGVQI